VTSLVEPHPALLAAARAALPDALLLPIATTATVGATRSSDAVVEAMEGFAVLRACALAGVPAIEVRVVSNELGERDRARWELEPAFEMLAGILPGLRAALAPE